jgi:hypothetical protein
LYRVKGTSAKVSALGPQGERSTAGQGKAGQRAESREQRTKSREQRAESREQRAESREHRTESREQRAREVKKKKQQGRAEG